MISEQLAGCRSYSKILSCQIGRLFKTVLSATASSPAGPSLVMSTQFAANTRGKIFYEFFKFTQSSIQSGNCLITSVCSEINLQRQTAR